VDKSTIREVMRAMGKKGGKASGPARMEKMTAEERSDVARKAAKKSAQVRSKKAAAKRKATKATKKRP
jgi:general stress protein YciG